jgi:drug/metabolite transporter (DMT)-like permease
MSTLVVIYAITLFKAFDIGKLSVIESVMILELPLAVGMSVIWLGDRLNTIQIILFLIICSGVALATVKDIRHLNYSKHLVEKGVWLAFAGAGLAAVVDVFISSSAQNISPLITLWYQHAFIVVIFGTYLTFTKGWSEFFLGIKTHPFLMLGQGVCDNIAWLSFVFAVNYISTSLVMSISEGYIIVAVILGHFLNKEKLKVHKVLGMSLAVPAMLILAYISS